MTGTAPAIVDRTIPSVNMAEPGRGHQGTSGCIHICSPGLACCFKKPEEWWFRVGLCPTGAAMSRELSFRGLGEFLGSNRPFKRRKHRPGKPSAPSVIQQLEARVLLSVPPPIDPTKGE